MTWGVPWSGSQVDSSDRAGEDVGDEYLGVSALIVDCQVPGAVQQFGVCQSFDDLAVGIEDLQCPLADRRAADVWRVADDNEAGFQHPKRGVQTQ